MNNIPSPLKNINLEAVLRSRGIYLLQAKNKALKEAAMPLAKKMLTPKQKAPEPQRHSQFSNEQVMAYWEKQIRIVDVIESKFEKKVDQFIDKVVQGFLKQLDQEVNNIKQLKSKDFFGESEEEWLVKAQFDFTPLLMDQVILSGQEAYKLLNIDDVYLPYKLRDQVAINVEKFTRSMLETDKEHLIKRLVDGLQEGKSVPEIRNIIEQDFVDLSRNQAQRITRTEVLRASNQASLDAYEQSGVVEGKQWLTAGAADECAQYEGQIVTLSNGFYSSDNEFQDGDPPLHPNCRCVILPVVVDTKAYVPKSNTQLVERIKELEAQVDKRTKAYKEIKKQHTEDKAYIKALENLAGPYEPPRET